MKIDLIISNKDKYSISAMCRLLKISRSLVYYHIKHRENMQKDRLSEDEIILENKIIKIFKESKNNYSTRKIL